MLEIISLIFLQEIFCSGKSINNLADYIWIQEIYVACNLSDHLRFFTGQESTCLQDALGQTNKSRVMRRGLEEVQSSS
jgi:hypothetical protein